MDTAPDTVEAARLAAALGSDTAVLLACAFAVAKGGRLAATVAAVVMAARLLSLACMAAGGPVAPMIALAVEAALLLYLLSIALFSRPYWVLFTAAKDGAAAVEQPYVGWGDPSCGTPAGPHIRPRSGPHERVSLQRVRRPIAGS